MFNFKKQAFGLDISDFSVRFAELKRKGGALDLSAFGEARLPSGVVCGGEIKNEEKLSKIIKRALNSSKRKLKTNFVVSSLPEEKSYLDIIQMPLMPEEEIGTAVKFEAENHFPLPMSEVCFDFEKVSAVSNHKKYQEILIAAVPKTVIESYLRVLKNAGLNVLGLEIECLAITRAIFKKDEIHDPLLIIDFGGSRTTFIIYAGKSVRLTSTFAFSSCELTKIISEKLGVPYKEAEKMKIENGLAKNAMVRRALVASLNKLTAEIKNHLEYYKSHEANDEFLRDGNVEKILLCGAAANLKGLTDFLEEKLEIKVEYVNPWQNILKNPLKGAKNLPCKESLAYATTLGLALRGVNFK